VVPEPSRPLGGTIHLTLQLPLGETAFATVFLVKTAGPRFRLLRLKRWKHPAPATFLPRFRELRARLADFAEAGLPSLLAATMDFDGCPSVLSEFRQGVPLIECVRSGGIDASDALAELRLLRELTIRAHNRGLIHGSIVPGNMIFQSGQEATHLLDFGLGPLGLSAGREAHSAARDLAGFEAVARMVAELAGPAKRRRL